MKKGILWCLLLTKRLYKKATYLAILALIPILVLGYSATAQGDSGMMTVALAQQAPQAVVDELFAGLKQNSQLIRYTVCDTPAQAEELVRTGKADTAWIFPADFRGAVHAFIESPTQRNAIVTVLEREDNVSLMLAREKLSGAVYEYLAQELFLIYVREKNPALPEMTDEEMLSYYLGTEISDKLFDFNETGVEEAPQAHYLLSPVRGLLGVVITLCGLAAAMYHLRDTALGTFAWVPERRQILPELGCQLVAVGNISLIAWLTLLLTGMAQSFWLELAALVLCSLCVSTFCMLLRRLLGGIRGLGTALPVLIVGMLLACPVFFDFAVMRYPQFLFPPTYYVNAVHNPRYMLYMLPYILITGGLCLLIDRIKHK